MKKLAVMVMVAGLAITGCKKESGDAGNGSAGSTNPLAKAAGTQSGPSVIGMLPADSTVIAGINVAGIQKSALYKKFLKDKFEKEVASDLNEFKEKCGFDPLESLQSLTIGANPKTEKVAVVMTGISKSKALECGKKDESMSVDGNYVGKKDDGGILFVSNNTAIAGEYDKAGLEALAKGTGLDKNKAVTDSMKKTNTGKTIWFTALEVPPMPGAPVNFKSGAGWVNVGDSLELDIALDTGSPDAAAGMVKQWEGQKAMVGMIGLNPDDISVTADGAVIKTKAKISAAAIEAIMKMAGGM